MAPKFGNYLFRNLKGQSPEQAGQSESKQAEALGSLEEQPVLLRAGDLDGTGQDAPILDWAKVEGGKIQIQLKDTEGILEGRVTVRASVLRRVCPSLFSELSEHEHLYPVSLKTVVLQIQAHLRRYQREVTRQADPDFDTPIAQVAREDEGFFKLEENVRPLSAAEESKTLAKPPGPILTPADRPTFPLIREKPLPADERAEPRTETEPLEVSVYPPKSGPINASPVEEQKFDPFQDLPKAGLKTSRDRVETERCLQDQGLPSDIQAREKLKRMVSDSLNATLSKPLRRIGLERLQEIFLTDDLLDAHEVARRIGEFPKVKGVLILFRNKTIMGGELPLGFDAGAALGAPDLIRAVQLFANQLSREEVSGLTILGDILISLFSYDSVSMVLVHEGRGLLPGMRERMSEVVRALHVLYDGLAIDP